VRYIKHPTWADLVPQHLITRNAPPVSDVFFLNFLSHASYRNKPHEKYISYKPVHLPDRQWPSKIVQQPPIWASTDLRDGNQALATPMSIEKKLLMFRHLVACGFKEIEVGFPSSSDTDFNFVRMLVADNEIPDDVWIQVSLFDRMDLCKIYHP
jgi:hypothetical protein